MSAKLSSHTAHMQVQLTDLLITKLSGRPADQEKARRAKQALQRKVAAELPVLQCWLAGGYVGFNLLPVEQRQHAESAAGRVEQWTAGARSSCFPVFLLARALRGCMVWV